MAKKLKFSIKERSSQQLGIIYDVFDGKGNKVKSFVSEELAQRFITQTTLEAGAEKAVRAGRPSGITKDLKKEFGENLILV